MCQLLKGLKSIQAAKPCSEQEKESSPVKSTTVGNAFIESIGFAFKNTGTYSGSWNRGIEENHFPDLFFCFLTG